MNNEPCFDYPLSIMHYPLVSAVVLNYRSPRDTVRCVQALRQQSIADALEIIVVDNHSEDESIGYIRGQLQSTPNVRIVEHPKNLGFGRGNNGAVRLARGDYLLILNPDNILPADALGSMVECLRSSPSVGMAGPALVHPDGTLRPSARAFPGVIDLLRKRMSPIAWRQQYDETMASYRKQDIVDVDWIVGGCFLMRMDDYRSLQGFDDRFFLFFEDIDLCRRVWNMGKRVVFLPNIQVRDQKSRLSGDSLLSVFTKKTARIHLVSACKYFWKWGLSHGRATA